MRIKLTVAYDGGAYCGWAISAGQPTIQSTLTQAIEQATQREVEIFGASRTDSGAHALGQVCHFDTDLPIEPAKWPRILNRVLPEDIVVVEAEAVGEDFHSRFCAEDRWYRYRIRLGAPDPFVARYVCAYDQPLDLAAMQAAARQLRGRHDFRAFTQELPSHVENTVRTLREVELDMDGQEIILNVVGTAFLRGMMRRMAGGILEVGSGRRSREEFSRLLENVGPPPVVLPARGLCLIRVRYANPPRDHRAE